MQKSTATAEFAVAVAPRYGWGRLTAAAVTDHPKARETLWRTPCA